MTQVISGDVTQFGTEYAVHSDGHVVPSSITHSPEQAAYVAHALGQGAHVVARAVYVGPWITVPVQAPEEVAG